MPFNVASIKEKAISAKNTTTTKFQDTRDRYSSTPMAKTRFAEHGYVPDARKAPPPPPTRSYGSRGNHASVSSRASEEDVQDDRFRPPPPPIVRNSKPVVSTSPMPSNANPSPPLPTRAPSFPRRKPWEVQEATPETSPTIDWAHLSSEDKQEFFSWLDEFFERFLSVNDTQEPWLHERAKLASNGAKKAVEQVDKWRPPSTPASVAPATSPSSRPPPIKSWSKPKLEHTISQPSVNTDSEMSYPPPTAHGSQALDLAYYIHPSTHWDTAWYAEDGAVPPLVRENPYRRYRSQYTFHGDSRGLHMGVLYGDLSACWITVMYSASNQLHPARITERKAWYLPPPAPLSKEQLVDASTTYNETIASFAEGYLGSGMFCARGECWDLASEALQCFAQFDYVDAPIPSINRTHGHLIFSGKALGVGRGQVGRWRGGDDRVRRGDIVEWRVVRINFVNAPPGSYATLGDPEHTAVITRDAVPEGGAPIDGGSLLPRALVALEVVEQSVNQPPEPKKQVYDMKEFSEGEMWIYRPVSMQAYLGFGKLEHTPPSHALSI